MLSSSSSSSSMEICYNPYCKNVRPEPSRRGWRLRNGDFAQLCDRCAYVFEEGRFCETFHSDAAGWRTCESCRKRIHCGCIVSVHTYALLDFGGVSCIACAKKNIIMPPKHRSTLSPFLHSPELVRDLSIKNCNPIAGHSLASGQWRHTFNIWNPPCIQSESHPRMRYEVDGIKLISEDSFATTTDNKKLEKPCDRAYGSLNLGGTDRHANENATGVDLVAAFNGMRKGEGNHDGLQGSNPHAGEKDLIGTRRVGLTGPGYMPFSGITHEPPIRSVVNDSVHASSSKGDQSHPPPSATVPAVPISSSNDGSNLNEVSREQSQQQTIQLPVTQEFNASIPPNGRDPADKTQVHNGRLRADARGRSPLQPRYWPRVTDQELQQISGDTNSVITPLFEKMLSASDAGKIGRLVLPKKCAEAYLPTISQPEGVPLKVQDAKGQEWVFQFRFWPNNNSRMYVLEGVTPCIHSMQLQAGDIVTFSRLDPGGKLVMGFRKASSIRQADQDSPSQRTSNNVSKDSEVNPADAANTLSKDKSSYIAKNVSGAESCVHSGKRKVRTVGPKGKRLRIETEESEKINLTWEEAQEMLRPPPNHVPSLVIIDDQEIEEYEEPPILGKPTISSIDSEGENVQWVQCGDCNKWRKLPSYTLLPPRWTCSVNSYDSTRSSCSSAQEITAEQLKDMLSSTESGSISKKVRAAKGRMNVAESSDGLKTLANLAILVEDETEPPSQPTTRHPRHRPGCTCIVCIQPPSGKGPKHKDTCTCTVCLMVKRRFQTQMLRREKRQSEKEAETARKKLQQLHLPETPEQCDGVSLAINTKDIDLPATSPTGECDAHQKMMVNNNTDDYDPNDKKPSNSPCKVGIDLNMQPEREDADSCSMTSNGDLVVDQVESEGAQDIGGSGSLNSDDAEGKAEDQLRLPNEHHIHAGLEAQVTQCDSKSAAVTTQ